MSPFPAIWSSWKFGRESSIRNLVDSPASKIHAKLDLKSLVLLRVSPCLHFLLVLQGTAGAIGVSNFLRAFLMVSVNSLSSSQWNKFLAIFLHYRVLVLQLPIYAFPSAQRSLTFLSRVLATNDLAWMSLAVLSVSLRTIHILLEFFSLSRVHWVKPVQESDKSLDPSIFF